MVVQAGYALRRQRQEDLYEFEVSLYYTARSRTGSIKLQKNPVSKTKQSKETNKKTGPTPNSR